MEWIKNNAGLLADIAGILAFLATIYIAAMGLLKKRKNFKVTLYKYTHTNDCHIFDLAIENFSQSLLILSKIELLFEDDAYCCNLRETVAKRNTRRIDGIPNETLAKTPNFPLRINPLESYSGHIVFQNCPRTFEKIPTLATFRFVPSRGFPLKRKLQLMQIDEKVSTFR